MNTQLWIMSLAGLLTAGTIAGLSLADRAQTAPQPLPSTVSPAGCNFSNPNRTPIIAQNQMMQIDQHFIEMMIPHHETAVVMADLALSRAKHPELKQLAQAIKRDQTREINEMRTWYKQWFGNEVPATSAMGGMMGGRGTTQGYGMMGIRQGQGMMGMDLNALRAAKDFDREFIRQMVPHHQMAVRMAQMLQNRTTRPEMKTLAQSIIKSQSNEINQMQQWYQTW